MRASILAPLLAIAAGTGTATAQREPIPVRLMVSSAVLGPTQPDTSELRRIFGEALSADSLVRVLPTVTRASAAAGRIAAAEYVLNVALSGSSNRMAVIVRVIDVKTTQLGLRDSVVTGPGEALDAAIATLGRRTARRLSETAPTRPPKRS